MKPPVSPAKKRNDMKHFLDIHKTDAAELRAMIDSAHAMKTARNNRPKGNSSDAASAKGRYLEPRPAQTLIMLALKRFIARFR